ncbi:hypothetical protein AGMMS49942_04040 [Spirochaetia bacterium]|nr:hypothetical protein AGMMS49942_04040 [Spirochaetia bacterium]
MTLIIRIIRNENTIPIPSRVRTPLCPSMSTIVIKPPLYVMSNNTKNAGKRAIGGADFDVDASDFDVVASDIDVVASDFDVVASDIDVVASDFDVGGVGWHY